MFMVCVVYLTMHAVIWFALPEQRNEQVWLWSASGLMSGLGVIALSTRGVVSEFVFIYIGQALMVFGNAGGVLLPKGYLAAAYAAVRAPRPGRADPRAAARRARWRRRSPTPACPRPTSCT